MPVFGEGQEQTLACIDLPTPSNHDGIMAHTQTDGISWSGLTCGGERRAAARAGVHGAPQQRGRWTARTSPARCSSHRGRNEQRGEGARAVPRRRGSLRSHTCQLNLARVHRSGLHAIMVELNSWRAVNHQPEGGRAARGLAKARGQALSGREVVGGTGPPGVSFGRPLRLPSRRQCIDLLTMQHHT